ncbi:glyceraldehyde-3-phosphate dehydrogenase [Gammaproteobacteria bacterium 45_16_T64]|nr:glyceraldehyde-3-phosphate dehydrogenase [Gammaproteobacteria bacterium 45_16_T64]
MSDKQKEHLQTWANHEAIAEAMIPLVGGLYRDNEVVTSVYGRAVINRSVIDILKAHRFGRQLGGEQLSVERTYPIIEAISKMDIQPAGIDIGKMADKYQQEGEGRDLEGFLRSELAEVLDPSNATKDKPQDIVLYGFGRIGRLLARILIEKIGGGNHLRLRAIVVRKGGASNDLEKRASLLRRDSVHGPFDGTIVVDEENCALIANGTFINVIYSNSPDSIDYTEYGINDAIIVDNTGIWRDEDGLGQHLKCPGASRVLLTAPGKGDIKNVVHGVNDALISDDDLILSAASCTTNAIVPALKAVNDEFGVLNGHVETVHSYTNDQNLIDNYHKGSRRGRSAALNMVLTETGAAKAVGKALPELDGKLTGNAIRVPTPNVSMAILNLNLGRETTVDELNEFLRETSLNSPLRKQIDYVMSPEVVSTDFVGSRYAGVVDGLATIAEGSRCVLYVWYDNEYGYSCQVIRMLQKLGGVYRPGFPK